ncbi:MAG: hypothetical protein E6Q33_09065 [Neisseriales bacterium]|nr:MAG: hypothetical protein E6Q33_09065 [Neisseriales bacterium]
MTRNLIISLDAKQLDYAKLALDNIKNGLPRAIQGAINTTLTAAKDTFYQAILRDYALNKIPSNSNGKILNIKRAKPNDLSGNLYFKDRNLPLFKFNVNPRRPAKRNPHKVNVIAEVLRGNPQSWTHAFIAKMKSGHIGVFTRTGKTEMTTKRKWINQKRNNKDKVKHYLITERYSTSIPQMIEQVYFKNPMVQDRIQEQANIKFEEQIIKILQKASK